MYMFPNDILCTETSHISSPNKCADRYCLFGAQFAFWMSMTWYRLTPECFSLCCIFSIHLLHLPLPLYLCLSCLSKEMAVVLFMVVVDGIFLFSSLYFRSHTTNMMCLTWFKGEIPRKGTCYWNVRNEYIILSKVNFIDRYCLCHDIHINQFRSLFSPHKKIN